MFYKTREETLYRTHAKQRKMRYVVSDMHCKDAELFTSKRLEVDMRKNKGQALDARINVSTSERKRAHAAPLLIAREEEEACKKRYRGYREHQITHIELC